MPKFGSPPIVLKRRLAEIVVRLLKLRILQAHLSEPLLRLRELLLILALDSVGKVHQSKIEHALHVTLLRRFLVELIRRIAISLDPMTELIASAQIGQSPREPSVRGFFEPLSGLFEVPHLVVEE